MLPQDLHFVETDHCADLCARAHQWGQQDALERIDLRGSSYFLIGSAAWHSYNDGYDVGLQLRKQSASAEEMSELEFMDYVLDTLRAAPRGGCLQGAEPIIRLTDEQLAEIEDERPGEDFTHYPFLY